MADRVAAETASLPRSMAAAGQSTLDRIYSFRVLYFAIFVFLVLFVLTIVGAENLLDRHFDRAMADAVDIRGFDRPIDTQLRSNVSQGVYRSPWVTTGGVRLDSQVFARDGSLVFLNGHSLMPPPEGLDPAAIMRQAERLLPLTSVSEASVPIDSLLSGGVLVVYAAVLLQALFLYNRRVATRQNAILQDAQAARDATLARTRSIELELESVRGRLSEVEPAEQEHAEEIRALQTERESLQSKLAALASREEELRGSAARAVDLDQERQALEDLLDEAAGDLASKNDEIRKLERRLKRESRGGGAAGGGRGKESEALGRRLRTLYKNIEIDDRAVDDLVKLRDESMKLKAEESLKRLADESENVAVRRKVGGLPPHLSIFELGFAGKGRIYYTKGRQRRFRVLTVGAKNTQKPDLEYLSRLPRED